MSDLSNVRDVHDRLSEIQLVDVREPYEWEAGRVDGAVHIPVNAIMSGRRGQILGFDTREGWDGWDVVRALMPESEIGDLIIEVRSATAGVGTFTAKFDHMAELSGKSAEQIVAARKAAAAAA